jgi:D-sedoheptulose 7-phosphate isomerase
VKGASYGREKRFRIMALTDQLGTITAYANDVGFEAVFEQHLRNFARPGDVVIAISGSGNSPNVLRAVEYANQAGCVTVGLSGFSGGKLAPMCRHSLVARSNHMGRVEDAHMFVCHLIAYHFMENEATRPAEAPAASDAAPAASDAAPAASDAAPAATGAASVASE